MYATEQPPVQFTLAPQLTFAFAARTQFPLQVPWQVPPQWTAAEPGIAVQFPVH